MKLHDCFNWENYTESFYEREMFELIEKYKLEFIISDFSIENGEIKFVDNLHQNWKELYHQINKLEVKSVFECGCGNTHHLINIFKIDNTIDIGGCDYSQKQIDLGKKYFELENFSFSKNLKITDLTKEIDVDKKYEFVFTQAVVMHLAHDRAKKFLSNMGKLSSKYIFLIENETYHNFFEMIKEALPEFEVVEHTKKYVDYGILLKLKGS